MVTTQKTLKYLKKMTEDINITIKKTIKPQGKREREEERNREDYKNSQKIIF